MWDIFTMYRKSWVTYYTNKGDAKYYMNNTFLYEIIRTI